MGEPISDNDAFLLSELLDGNLPADRAAVLRHRIQREPELQAAFDAMTRIDESLADRGRDQPSVDWARFHRNVMNAIATQAGTTGACVEEQDQFLLSRLLDGDLLADEATALRRRLEREPALRAAFESLAQVDALLEDRRADWPTVDWPRFREAVMDAVEAETSAPPAIIRSVHWMRVGVPLAAAAAIAVLVTLYRSGPETDGPEAGPGPGPVVAVVPSGDDPAPTLVRFKRHWFSPRAEAGVIQVTFAQSAQLEEVTQQQDRANRERPSSVIAGVGPPSLPDPTFKMFMEALPL